MPKEFYRVTMIDAPGAPTKTWTNYTKLEDAIDAASGLLTSDIAIESEVIWVRSADDTASVLRLILNGKGEVVKAPKR